MKSQTCDQWGHVIKARPVLTPARWLVYAGSFVTFGILSGVVALQILQEIAQAFTRSCA